VPVGAYERSPASSPWSVAPDLDRGHVSGIGEVGRASWPCWASPRVAGRPVKRPWVPGRAGVL